MNMKEVLYVPSLKKSLLSVSTLDKKGYRVSFIDGQVLMWSKGNTLEYVVVIGEEEGGLLSQVNYGIGGLLTSTTNNYPMRARW